MRLINHNAPATLILLISAFQVLCAPYATHRSIAEQQDHRRTHPATTSSHTGCRTNRYSDCSGPFMSLDTREPRENLVVDIRVPTGYHVAPLTASLACVTSLLLILLILKVTYLKNRRMRTIHNLPNFCAAWSEVEEEDGAYEHPLPRRADTLTRRDVRSLQSQSRRHSSEPLSSPSSKSEPLHRQLRDSIPGVLVGMLGSPDWETRMQRELANHQWRLRRESHYSSIKSQHRHTWHSQRSYDCSRGSTAHSHLQSASKKHRDYRPGRHSSLRIPHVTSFGEMYPDTFREKKGRPKSLNAVIDQMSAGRSGSITAYSPAFSNVHSPGSYGTEPAGGSGFSMPTVSLSQRPSTIREVDTPPPTVTLPQEATFRFQVTDYDDGIPLRNTDGSSSVYSPATTGSESTESGFGTANMELSSTSEYLNASRESSLGGSWRQLPYFPSPPASPGSPVPNTPQFPDAIHVNAVHVRPRYFRDDFYDAKVSKSGIFGASGLGFLRRDKYLKVPRQTATAFSPLTLDLGFPTLSDLLVSDLLNLGPPPTDERHDKQVDCVRLSPVKSALSSSPVTKQQLLNPLSATALNRHHSRVREHVPFSIITPPTVYLKSPRTLERSVRFALGNGMVGDNSGRCSAFPHAASLVDLSTPVRPSPLRRVASLGSIGPSRTSLRSSVKRSDASKNSNASSDVSVGRVEEKTRELGDGSLQVKETDLQTLRPQPSHTSLFLDLGSSPGYEDDRSESYSFGLVESSGIDQSFNYSQASSSGIDVTMENCSDEDADYTAQEHSDSLMQGNSQA